MLAALRELAQAAGNEILTVYRRAEIAVQLKADRTPVTEADHRANSVIEAGLKKLDGSLPTLTEESRQSPWEVRKEWQTFWLVDPMDGTKEFLGKNGQFTVNIALIDRGVPVLGVVWAPVSEVMYYAQRGQGAHKVSQGREEAIATRKARKDCLTLVASRSHAGAQIEQLQRRYSPERSIGMGSSLKLCLIAEGSADLYLRDRPTMEWDTGAAHAVVREAGGAVEAWNGSEPSGELRYNKENLKNPQFLVRGDPQFAVYLDPSDHQD